MASLLKKEKKTKRTKSRKDTFPGAPTLNALVEQSMSRSLQNHVSYLVKDAPRVPNGDAQLLVFLSKEEHARAIRFFDAFLKMGIATANWKAYHDMMDEQTVYVTLQNELWLGKEQITKGLAAQLDSLPGGNYTEVEYCAVTPGTNMCTIRVRNTWKDKGGEVFSTINDTTVYYRPGSATGSGPSTDPAVLGRALYCVDTGNMFDFVKMLYKYFKADLISGGNALSTFISANLTEYKRSILAKLHDRFALKGVDLLSMFAAPPKPVKMIELPRK